MALQLDRIHALLFDLDGTLVETDNQMVERWARPLGRVSWVWRAADGRGAARWLVMRAEGPGNALITLLDRMRLDAPLGSLNDRFQRLGGARSPADAGCVAGVPGALAALKEKYPMALVTTRGRATAQALLAAAGLGGIFSVFATREDTLYMKPDPAPVRLAARLLGVAPENCLMIGDTTVDILAGRRAGAQTAGVLCGFGERDELVRAGADLLLDNTSLLAKTLLG